MFQILVYYRDEDTMQQYIRPFLYTDRIVRIRRDGNITVYEGLHTLITCVRGLREISARGRKAHIIAVQEELTWSESWPETRDCIIRPAIISPIDVQVFDGITREEDAA